MIRWALQHDLLVVTKSLTEKNIREQGDVFDFEISKEDMAVLVRWCVGGAWVWSSLSCASPGLSQPGSQRQLEPIGSFMGERNK